MRIYQWLCGGVLLAGFWGMPAHAQKSASDRIDELEKKA